MGLFEDTRITYADKSDKYLTRAYLIPVIPERFFEVNDFMVTKNLAWPQNGFKSGARQQTTPSLK